jgi:hypothetical protein
MYLHPHLTRIPLCFRENPSNVGTFLPLKPALERVPGANGQPLEALERAVRCGDEVGKIERGNVAAMAEAEGTNGGEMCERGGEWAGWKS